MTKAPYVTEDYTPLTFGMLFFCEVILLLVEERNRYYHHSLTHWTNDSPHCLRWLCKKYIGFWQLLCKWGIS